ncbi:hypothetical protein COCOBI_15-3060 [Coccomyxa sp. Obi]|nr:hypothetical protein COCOBI_15-3060 [Coccomyxa sp. Obi]
MSQKGARQKAHRRRQKDKQQANQHLLEELSKKILSLERERAKLQGALGTATRGLQDVQLCSADQAQPEDDAIAVRLCFGEPTTQLQLTRQQCKTLSVSAMAGIWKRLVQKMAASLDGMASHPRNNHIRKTLQDLREETVAFMWAMLELNPHTFDALKIISIDSPSMPQAPTTDTRDWPAILAGIQLSREQEGQLLACRRTALQGFGALAAERESLWAQLQSIEDVEEQSGFATTRFTEATKLLEQLCANMNGMHTCCCFYLTNIYGKLLTPVQVARYLVSCLPRGPDTIELVTVLARQRNEPSNEELLRAASPGTAADAEIGTSGFSTSNHCVWRAHDWRQDFAQPLRMLHQWQGTEFI